MGFDQDMQDILCVCVCYMTFILCVGEYKEGGWDNGVSLGFSEMKVFVLSTNDF